MIWIFVVVVLVIYAVHQGGVTVILCAAGLAIGLLRAIAKGHDE